jgi:hypothetical protein
MEAKCPMKLCKGELSKVFLKPVGLKSDKTKATDKNLKNLALDFGMTDIKSTRAGRTPDRLPHTATTKTRQRDGSAGRMQALGKEEKRALATPLSGAAAATST